MDVTMKPDRATRPGPPRYASRMATCQRAQERSPRPFRTRVGHRTPHDDEPSSLDGSVYGFAYVAVPFRVGVESVLVLSKSALRFLDDCRRHDRPTRFAGVVLLCASRGCGATARRELSSRLQEA